MSTLFFNPWNQYLNGSSQVFAGAKLTFYKSGTTTKQDTYTDSDLTVAHTNPVVADSAGYFDPIYLDGSLPDYKCVLSDSEDTILQSVDPLNPIDSSIIKTSDLLADLEAVTDLSGIRYVLGRSTVGDGYEGLFLFSSGNHTADVTADTSQAIWVAPSSDPTGASGAWKREHQSIYLKWFGAAGDGITDDTTAIQNAHDVAVANGYKALFFTAGRYKFTSELNISSHITFKSLGDVYLETSLASGRAINVSDEFGRPATYGLNAPKNVLFEGSFHIFNLNGSNTTRALAFGGSTASYYCNNVIVKDVEIRGFTGGVFDFRYNAFGIEFFNCYEYNNGDVIIVEAPTTNVITSTNFFGCVFASSTVGYLLSINNTNALDFNFYGCECVYKLGFNRPSQTATFTKVSWFGGNMEWDTVAATYIINDGGATFNIDGITLLTTLTSGWATPFVTQTSGTSMTRFVNARYITPTSIPKLHDVVDSTSRGIFDYSPDYQGAGAPITFLSYHASSEIGYEGITSREVVGSTATWSGTIGDGSITQTYSRVGRTVNVFTKIAWGSTTSHPASSQTISVPFQADAIAAGVGSWWANDSGTSLHLGTAVILPGGTAMLLYDDATTAQVSNTVPMTWAVNDELIVQLTYFI